MNPVLDDKALEYVDKAMKERQWEPISDKNKVLMAAGMAAIPAATHMALGLRIGMNLIPKTLIMGALGYAIPSIVNAASNKTDDERKEFLRSEFDRISQNPFSKQASILPMLGKGFVRAGKYSLEGGRDFLRGVVSPVKGKTLGQTAMSVGSKALLGYGAYQSGKYLINKFKRPDYIDYMRNQILAGNIKPEELSQRDLGRVKEMGMK